MERSITILTRRILGLMVGMFTALVAIGVSIVANGGQPLATGSGPASDMMPVRANLDHLPPHPVDASSPIGYPAGLHQPGVAAQGSFNGLAKARTLPPHRRIKEPSRSSR